MSRPYRKDQPPRYRNRITAIEKLPIALRTVLRRLWLAKEHGVPVRVQTHCDSRKTAEAWIAVWSTMGLQGRLHGEQVVVMELSPGQVKSAKLLTVRQVKTITRTKAEQALLDVMEGHIPSPASGLEATTSRSPE